MFALPSTGGSKPFAWGGAGNIYSLTDSANCPNSSIVVFHKNQLFTNDLTNKSRIHFSDLTGGTGTLTNLNFFDVNANDGSQIRGMISAFNALYIFKDRLSLGAARFWCL